MFYPPSRAQQHEESQNNAQQRTEIPLTTRSNPDTVPEQLQNNSRTNPEPATKATCVPGITSLPPSPLLPPPHFPDSSSNETKSRKTGPAHRHSSPSAPLLAGSPFLLGGESVDRDGLAGEPPPVRVSSIRKKGENAEAGQQAVRQATISNSSRHSSFCVSPLYPLLA